MSTTFIPERFLQSPFWTSFKASHGWKTMYFSVNGDEKTVLLSEEQKKVYERSGVFNFNEDSLNEQSVIKRPFVLSLMTRTFRIARFKKLTIAYVPMALEFKGNLNNPEEVKQYFCEADRISGELKKYLPDDTICIRYDFPVDLTAPEERDAFVKNVLTDAKKEGFKKSSVCVQPPDTTILNLLKTEEELLSSMKNKWRYNIRLSSKKGVRAECYTASSPDFDKAFETFYRLFQITSERDKVSFHAKDYYRDLLEKSALYKKNGGSKNEVRLYLAFHEEDALSGIITIFSEKEAVYLYGASSNVKRNLMAPYLLQWTAIKDAKDSGCISYDFYGMPPDENPSHPMHGLYLFKTGFGGLNTHRIGTWDFPLKKADYAFYKFAEKMRAWFFRVLRKKL